MGAGLHRISAAVFLFAAFSGLAEAKPIPTAELAADRRVCVASCTSRGMAVAQCSRFCDCTFQEVGKQFTAEEYAAGKAATRQNQPPPQSLVDKLTVISNACVDSME